MTVEEVYELITSNKNHKKYKIDKNVDSFTLTLGNFRLTVNKAIADNIESEIPYRYLTAWREDRVAKVHNLEKDINVLLGRDWEQQEYARGFHVFIGEPEENGDWYIIKDDFIKYDDYDVIDDVTIDDDYDVTDGGADASFVRIQTICSLPKATLDPINDVAAYNVIDSDAATYSSKYTDWYGLGFSKNKF